MRELIFFSLIVGCSSASAYNNQNVDFTMNCTETYSQASIWLFDRCENKEVVCLMFADGRQCKFKN